MILLAGVFAISTAAIFIRLAIAAAGTSGIGFSLLIAAIRMLIAAVVIIPSWRTFQPQTVTRAALGYGMLAGVCLALHVAAWISSLSFTSITAATTLV
ncbi:MAG: EamA family transporter, partial [Spirulina sp. SIO3F2]|nr:EamA family transporter [Spirulina sp. SIO3F2]